MEKPEATPMMKDVQIVDPDGFLKDVRQKLWRGQSYDAMFHELAKLVFCKWYAEQQNKPFNINTYKELWEEARKTFRDQAGVEFTKIEEYSDNRIQDTVGLLSKYKVSGNNQLQHIMQAAWLNKTANKKDGQYFTPPFIKKFMIEAYQPQSDQTICDPCGGSGGFLIEAADHLGVINNPKLLHYYDIDASKAFKSAKMAFVMHMHKSGVNLAGIEAKAQDSLATEWDTKMDRTYTNVPFGVRITDKKILEKFKTGCVNGKPKAGELSQVLFLEKCIQELTPTGKSATVVDKGVVTNDRLVEDRKHISKLAYLELVVELPGDAFTYCADTSFPTYLLFFSKTQVSKTYFAKVENLGYDDSGFGSSPSDDHNFSPQYEKESWEKSDFVKILKEFADGTLPSVDYNRIIETGSWHYGAHKYNSWSGKRLKDLATIIENDYDGKNILNPTVDRQFKIISETHLNPKCKTQALELNCILMSRLLSDQQSPCCGIVTQSFGGAGCTDENYVIKPKNDACKILLWHLINFDDKTSEYLHDNSKGQGRGRIKIEDLLNMPIYDVSIDKLKKSQEIINLLAKKIAIDEAILAKISSI